MGTIGLMADPGVPEAIARSIADNLANYLSKNLQPTGDEQDWNVQVARGTLPITAEGMIPLLDHAQNIQKDRDWDFTFYLLDLPQWHEEEPLLSFASSAPAAALISIPALGARQLRKRTQNVILLLIKTMRGRDAASTRHIQQRVKWIESDDKDKWYVLAPGRKNRLRLLAGMVRSNRPGRLLSVLSNSLAAAVATGAFGVFYASLWNLADELSPLRHVFIGVLAMGLFTTWLIVDNHLWNKRPSGADGQQDRRDNLVTILTVGISVTSLYLALFLALLIGAVIIIAPTYLETELDSKINIFDYVRLAWLAASLGTFAGALGSKFDADADIESATYSRRVYHRRQLANDAKD